MNFELVLSSCIRPIYGVFGYITCMYKKQDNILQVKNSGCYNKVVAHGHTEEFHCTDLLYNMKVKICTQCYNQNYIWSL